MMDVILRAENVDSVKPGDRIVVTGMLAVRPDVSVLALPGEKVKVRQGKALASLEIVLMFRYHNVGACIYRMLCLPSVVGKRGCSVHLAAFSSLFA